MPHLPHAQRYSCAATGGVAWAQSGRGGAVEDVERFCERVRPELVRTLTAACRDVGTAEELAQETLVRAWERWDHVSSLERPEAWCHRVAMNLSHSRWRRVHAEARALARVGPSSDFLPDATGAVEDRDQLAHATRALSEQERRVLVLRHVAGLPVEEVAAELDRPPGSVTSTASRATAKVRAALAAALLASAVIWASSHLAPPTPAPTIVDVVDGDRLPAWLPDGFEPCPSVDTGAAAWCRGGARVTLRTGSHDSLAEVGTPLPVGPRTGHLARLPDGRWQLTVSDRTSSADLHYRVLSDDTVSPADLVRLVESIPAFARATSEAG